MHFIVRSCGIDFEIESMVRGYHCYNAIWDATIGEKLPCKLELSNPEYRFAVAVVRGEVTIGHVSKRISSICSSFLRRGGTITCKTRRYSADLPQGPLSFLFSSFTISLTSSFAAAIEEAGTTVESGPLG